MVIEQHIEELRAELTACDCPRERKQIEKDLGQAQQRLRDLTQYV